MTNEQRQSSWRDLIGPMAVALVALIAVVLTLDAAGDYPKLFEGPGITLDESFNVQMGVYQVEVVRTYGLGLLDLRSVEEAFGPESRYNPDHPPLGRLWLGICHNLTRWLFPPADHPSLFVTDCARVGSATAFAFTVFLIGLFATKWYGRAGGIVAAVSLVLMPRVFAHAHLASLETFMNLTYSATILAVAHWWSVKEDAERVNVAVSLRETNSPHGARRLCWAIPTLTGVLFGLALLTKIQAILIPPVVAAWALWYWRTRAIVPLAIFGVVGFVVFFVGWPWLWLDPAAHLREYFARTTGRAVLNCYYLGQAWADKDVPWHFPFVMFAVTVPVGLHVLGLLGVCGKTAPLILARSASEGASTEVPRLRFGLVSAPREQLILAATLFPLVLFALPGVAVYDGERLFLVSYPIWAVLIGHGAMVANNWLSQPAEAGWRNWLAKPRRRVAVASGFLVLQAVGLVVMHPCQLSYYNLLVGGLWGADQLGFERTYWGDSITRSLLREVARAVPRESKIIVSPVLHQFQLDELSHQSPILRNQGVKLVAQMQGGVDQRTTSTPWILFYRNADLDDRPDELGSYVRVVSRGCSLAVAVLPVPIDFDRDAPTYPFVRP